MHSLLAPRPMYERSSASIILSYKVRIPVYCASSTLEFSKIAIITLGKKCVRYPGSSFNSNDV